MKNLFYDLEFASCVGGHKICEIGYVVTDENYNVLEEENIIVNPRIAKDKWDYFALKKVMKRKRSEFEVNNKFSDFYDKLKNLFFSVDHIIGHSTSNDAKALNDECIRYNLPSIDHKFYDINEFYKLLNKIKKNTSLETMLQELDVIGDLNLHSASADAYNTMVVLRTLISKYNTNLEALINECPLSIDISKDYKIESLERAKELRIKKELEEINLIRKGSKNWSAFHKFLDEVKPGSQLNNNLDGKKVCISFNYEKDHFKESVNLIQLVTDAGGTYTLKGSECDIFVEYPIRHEDGTYMYCGRLKSVEIHKEDKDIRIISFKDFLNMLHITNEELEELPLPYNVKVVYDGKRVRGKKKRKITNNTINTYKQLNSSIEIIN